MVNDKAFSAQHWKRTVDYANSIPHSKRGFSSLTKGKCIGAMLLKHFLNIPFEGHSRTIPGTNGHEFEQIHIFKPGEIAFDRYEIIAHEVPVFLTINGDLRWSYIDTLVYDLQDKCFEVWDYKFIAYSKYQVIDAKESHKDQANLYAYLIGALRYRIIYSSKAAYGEKQTHSFSLDETMAKVFIERLSLIDGLKKGLIERNWSKLTLCELQKDSAKRECKYCMFKEEREYNGKIYPAYCIEKYKEEFLQEFKDLRAIKAFLKKTGVIQVEKVETTIKV